MGERITRRARLVVSAIVVTVALFGLQAGTANAAAPSNDNFANATVLSTSSTGSIAGTNVDATYETGEPYIVLDNYSTVWYSWTPASSGWVRFAVVLGTLSNSTLGLYTGTAVNSLSTVATNDECGGITSNGSCLSFNAASGTTYRIRVAGAFAFVGTFTLQWAPDTTPPVFGTTTARVQGAKVTVNFSAVDPNSITVTYQCKLDDGAYATCTSPYIAELSKGAYTLSIRATARGQADTSVTFSIKSGKIKA